MTTPHEPETLEPRPPMEAEHEPHRVCDAFVAAIPVRPGCFAEGALRVRANAGQGAARHD